MHFELKPISKAAVSEALEKAKRYRLLNEPALAESICLDVLEVEPENQRALVTLLLAITDQFGHGAARGQARELLPRLKSEYEQRYYAGIIWERVRARAAPQRRAQCLLQCVRCLHPGHARAMKRRSNCGPRATMTQFCAGTPARGF